jgi:hypothetical protein
MERSPLPPRRQPLRARSQLQRGGRLRQQSVKRQSERERRQAVVEATLRRAGYRCEAEVVVPEVACGGPLDVDEKAARGVHPGAHLDLSLTQVLCRRHHEWRHANPAEAHARGLRLHSWEVER